MEGDETVHGRETGRVDELPALALLYNQVRVQQLLEMEGALIPASVGMMFIAMLRQSPRWLVLLLVGLAFLGGTTLQALPPSSMAVTARASTPMPGCTGMAGMTQDTDSQASHKGITPDCVKLMQCLGTPDLPTQVRLADAPVTYSPVVYWSPSRIPGGLSPEPAAIPPRLA